MTHGYLSVALTLTLTVLGTRTCAADESLKAGAAISSITPPLGQDIVGGVWHGGSPGARLQSPLVHAAGNRAAQSIRHNGSGQDEPRSRQSEPHGACGANRSNNLIFRLSRARGRTDFRFLSLLAALCGRR